MPRFSSWAEEQLHKYVVFEAKQTCFTNCEGFIVDNSRLKSKSIGVCCFSSPQFEDRNIDVKPIPWGTQVFGTLDRKNSWLRLQSGSYIPRFLNGVDILVPVQCLSEDTDEEDTHTNSLQCEWKTLGTLKVPSLIQPPIQQELPEELSDSGAQYMVVATRVALRAGPSLGAIVKGSLRNGTVVDLFKWDDSRLWRQCFEPKIGLFGWVLLDHPELGPLIRPSGAPVCARALNPICVAAAEGQLNELKRFLFESTSPQEGFETCTQSLLSTRDHLGRSPLVLAAASSHFSCCTHLVSHGADAKRALAEAEQAVENGTYKVSAEGLLFLQALAGRHVSSTDIDNLLAKMTLEDRCLTEQYLDTLKDRAMTKFAHSEQAQSTHYSDVVGTVDFCQQQGSLQFQDPAPPVGILYEVVYSAVWIRSQPHTDGERLSKRMKGERIRLLDFDDTRKWGRLCVHLANGQVTGWMLLEHEELGPLLEPCPEM